MRVLHEYHPVRARFLAAGVAKQRLVWCEGQHFAQLYLCLAPLEDEHAIFGQHAKAL